MTRRPVGIALLAVAALLAAAGSASGSSNAPALRATVGPGFTIVLTMNGKRVTNLKAGSFRFVVTDKSSIHNFVLEKKHGGTFEKELSTVPFKGTKTVRIKLSAGEWEFYCHPHESTMHGDFTVK